jgi:hypothetical protein
MMLKDDDIFDLKKVNYKNHVKDLEHTFLKVIGYGAFALIGAFIGYNF